MIIYGLGERRKAKWIKANSVKESDRDAYSSVQHAGLPHFRFHDLRHYSASIQHALGIPDAYIMQRGGWKNDGVLKQVYRHTLEEKTAEMNRKVNGYFENLHHEMQHE